MEADRLEDQVLESILEGEARRLLDDERGKNVVGVRVEPAGGDRQSLVSGSRDQFSVRELVVEIGSDNLSDRHGLGIVRNAARHVEQLADGHAVPGAILRQPIAHRLIDVELALRFQLQHDRGFEVLGVAADLEERVAVDRGLVAPTVVARERFDDRARIAEVDVERDARKAFDVAALRNVVVEHLLDLRNDGRVIGMEAARAAQGCDEDQNADRTSGGHILTYTTARRWRTIQRVLEVNYDRNRIIWSIAIV